MLWPNGGGQSLDSVVIEGVFRRWHLSPNPKDKKGWAMWRLRSWGSQVEKIAKKKKFFLILKNFCTKQLGTKWRSLAVGRITESGDS